MALMPEAIFFKICSAAKSIPRQNYKEGILWDQQFFAGSGIKIPIPFGIRDQNFEGKMESVMKKYTSLPPCSGRRGKYVL